MSDHEPFKFKYASKNFTIASAFAGLSADLMIVVMLKLSAAKLNMKGHSAYFDWSSGIKMIVIILEV